MADRETDFMNNGNNGNKEYDLPHHENPDNALRKIRTAGSLSISPELFEKIYLSPKNRVHRDLRQTFGNPTPLALIGFVLSLTPLSHMLLGWRGSGGGGAADIGVYFFFGGLLMLIGGVLEWVLGNTFPFVVFSSFGAFWLAFAATLQPFYNASGAYSPDPTKPYLGATQPGFLASFAFFQLYMGLLCFIYLICAIRTNVVFFGIFLFLVPTFGCLAGSYWHAAQGNASLSLNLQKAGGGTAFVVSLLGWYILLVQMLAALDFPWNLPVGDLSGFIKGASERAADLEA